MSPALVDVDLDALAPTPKRVKLGGKVYRLPGDMPMGLFLRIQAFDDRVAAGESEIVLLGDLQAELLSLFQVHQPELKGLPEIGVQVLIASLGAIYGGRRAAGEPQTTTPATRPQRKRTASAPRSSRSRPATSR